MTLVRRGKSKRWTWRFRHQKHGTNKVIYWALFEDKAQSAEFAGQVGLILDYSKSPRPMPPELAKWIAELDAAHLARLVSLGVKEAEEYSQTRVRPLRDLVALWRLSLENKGRGDQHVTDTVHRAAAVLDGIGATRLADITSDTVEAYLRKRRDDGLSAAGSNHLSQSIKQFVIWLHRTNRIAANPLSAISKQNERADPKHERRAATGEEVLALLKAAREGPSRFNCSGEERFWMYLVMWLIGARRRELASLTTGSFAWGDEPYGTFEAAYTKHGKRRTVPLADDAWTNVLRQWVSTQGNGPLFHVPHNTSKMIQADLVEAGVPYRDAQGRVFDFYALRVTFATDMARTTDFFILMKLLGHSSPSMTARYVRPSQDEMRRAIRKRKKKPPPDDSSTD